MGRCSTVEQLANFPAVVQELIGLRAIRAFAFPEHTRGSAKRIIYFIQPAEGKMNLIYRTLTEHFCEYECVVVDQRVLTNDERPSVMRPEVPENASSQEEENKQAIQSESLNVSAIGAILHMLSREDSNKETIKKETAQLGC